MAECSLKLTECFLRLTRFCGRAVTRSGGRHFGLSERRASNNASHHFRISEHITALVDLSKGTPGAPVLASARDRVLRLGTLLLRSIRSGDQHKYAVPVVTRCDKSVT